MPMGMEGELGGLMGQRSGWLIAVAATTLVAANISVGAAPLRAPVAAAAPAPVAQAPSVSPTSVAEAPDYFTDTWADPLDFSNAEDFDTTPGRRAVGATSAVGNGVLDYRTTSGFGRLYFISSEPTEIDTIGHRQSTFRPLDSNKYTRLGMHAWTDRDMVAYLVWNHCSDGSGSASCQGYKSFHLRAGWHFYDLDLLGANDADSYTDASAPNSIHQSPWNAGPILRLGLQPSGTGVNGVRGLISHLRVFQPGSPGSSATVNTTGGNLWWDVDTTSGNNGYPGQGAGAGILRSVPDGNAVVDFGALGPGSYQLLAESGGSFGSHSAPFVVDAAPRPVVIDPDMAGSGDWSAEVRGNSADFSDPFDVFAMFDGAPSYRNVSVGIGGGELHASGVNSDPQLFFSDAWWNGPPIDATEWHRVSWRITYEGVYGTNSVPGEGLDARFCWQGLQGQVSCSKDVFPATRATTYATSLQRFPPSAVEPGGYSGLGWGGPYSQMVHLFRFDPHEDPGLRNWHLDWLRLSHDDRMPYGGSFNIQFLDAAWEPGTVADIYVDGDGPGGSLGRMILSGHPVVNGVNTVPWNGAGSPPGLYNVNVVLRDPRGSSRLATSTGPLDLPVPGKWTPSGVLDEAYAIPGGIYVAGWAVDPDTPRSPITMRIGVDATAYDIGLASAHHSGLARLRSDLGGAHGFRATVPASPGWHTVCAHANNVGYGSNNIVGCKQVFVK
jgi:hypothetical protein